jgi:hypothetical protein
MPGIRGEVCIQLFRQEVVLLSWFFDCAHQVTKSDAAQITNLNNLRHVTRNAAENAFDSGFRHSQMIGHMMVAQLFGPHQKSKSVNNLPEFLANFIIVSFHRTSLPQPEFPNDMPPFVPSDNESLTI